ncbi:Calcium-dependent protein kinase 2 [Cytospora mali]|uniref:Calcium-dependent protein kinase 2 n=1 Tax=Cytospora mali TaxID=578113 RepID=A0A194WDW0_CYTMA|nr:Calcium-dependent protein kinase 2 [Valsa mali]
MPDPKTQSTNPYPDGFLQARLSKLSGQEAASVTQNDHPKSQGAPLSNVTVDEPEQLPDQQDGNLQAWLAEISARATPDHPPSVPSSYLVTQAAHFTSGVENGLQEGEHLQEDLQKIELGLDLLDLQCDPRFRLIFHHPDGNSAMKIESVGAQEFIAQPKAAIIAPEDPLLIKLWGSLQSRSEVRCSLTVNSLRCDFYYLPHSDDVILHNAGVSPMSIVSRSSGACSERVQELLATTIQPGQWRISNGDSTVDLQLMPRRYFLEFEEDPRTGAVKRPAEADNPSIPTKKAKAPAGAVTTASPLHPMAQPQPVLPREDQGPVWAGVNLDVNCTVTVTDAVTGQPEYSLRRLTNWSHKNSQGEAFKAILDDGRSKPQAVLAKRMGYNPPTQSNQEEYRRARYAARAWLQEFTAHWRLQHDRIVPLLAWDSRMLCLCIELKPSHDLSSTFWREDTGPGAGLFRGDIGDACCILAHISSALAFLGKHRMLHNDIKPANILYSKVDLPATGPYSAAAAGAILIDFGLAGPADIVSTGGTPWYVAPEFKDGERDLPSDVFSLGVVLLYAMRCIVLPEKWRRYPGWSIRDVRRKVPAAIKAMEEWVDAVETQLKELKISDDAGETELRNLVCQMLLPHTQRIGASELAEATSKWDLSPFLETGARATG